MKIERALKKINQDVLMGIIIGIMLVILACFLGVCFSPKRGLLEGMDNQESTSDSQSNSNDVKLKQLHHQNYVATTASMNSACSLEKNQSDCNKKSNTYKGKEYPCTWNIKNKRCDLDFEKASYSNWDSAHNSSKTPSLTPASTSSTASTPSTSSTK